MKDYLLSEIKEYCKQQCVRFAKPYKNGTKLLSPCKKCEMLETICKETLPVGWDIEQRDMIELPRKEEFEFVQNYGMVRHWRVYYLDKENNIMQHKYFLSEFEADEFIEKLKEDRK